MCKNYKVPAKKMNESDDQMPSILNNQVSLSNVAARAAQGFTLREKRLVMAGLSKLDGRKAKSLVTLKERTFRVTASEYADISQIADPKSAYKDMIAACEKLLHRHLRYKIMTPRGERERALQWIGGVTYHHGEGWVEFSIGEEVMPHICGLSKRFTKYRLQQTSELRSVYSWRLLELLTSYNDARDESTVTIRKVSIDALREALEIPASYKYDDIKRQVITKGVEELVKKDHWLIQWRPIKDGKSVVAIEFTFRRDPQTNIFSDRDQNTVDWVDELA